VHHLLKSAQESCAVFVALEKLAAAFSITLDKTVIVNTVQIPTAIAAIAVI
jgi:hypothetical protein